MGGAIQSTHIICNAGLFTALVIRQCLGNRLTISDRAGNAGGFSKIVIAVAGEVAQRISAGDQQATLVIDVAAMVVSVGVTNRLDQVLDRSGQDAPRQASNAGCGQTIVQLGLFNHIPKGAIQGFADFTQGIDYMGQAPSGVIVRAGTVTGRIGHAGDTACRVIAVVQPVLCINGLHLCFAHATGDVRCGLAEQLANNFIVGVVAGLGGSRLGGACSLGFADQTACVIVAVGGDSAVWGSALAQTPELVKALCGCFAVSTSNVGTNAIEGCRIGNRATCIHTAVANALEGITRFVVHRFGYELLAIEASYLTARGIVKVPSLELCACWTNVRNTFCISTGFGDHGAIAHQPRLLTGRAVAVLG